MDLPTENDKVISRKDIDSEPNESWLRILKKSFGIGKNRTRSKPTTVFTNPSTFFDNKSSKINSNNVDKPYYTDEFLDSFTSKSNKTRFVNNFFRFKSRNINPNMFTDLPNKINFQAGPSDNIIEESNKMESILLQVVDDYIYSTCEKMLQDKMRYVYQKMQNWYKNPLARPGFKKNHRNVGGNITKPEKYSLPRQVIIVPKKENHETCPEKDRKELLTKNIKKITLNIEKSSNLNNSVSEKVNVLKSSKYLLSNNYFGKEKALQSTEKIDTAPDNEVNISETKSKVPSNLGFLFCKAEKSNSVSEPCSKVLSIKCSQNNYAKTIKNNDSSLAVSVGDESSSKILVPSQIPSKIKRESFFKLSKSRKVSNKTKIPKESAQRKDEKSKSLIISKMTDIDIKPLANEDCKNFEINTEDKNQRNLIPTFSNVDQIIRQEHKEKDNINFKRRRYVTFQEPKISNLSMPFCKESIFCSNVDIRTTRTLTNVTSSCSEELNGNFSSKPLASFQHIKNTNAGTSKTETSSLRHLDCEDISDLRKNSNSYNNHSYDCDASILNTNKSNSHRSPVFVSIHSTSSLSDDNFDRTHELTGVNDDNYVTYDSNKNHVNTTIQSLSIDKTVITTDENRSNYYTFDEPSKTSPISGHNYSIIEIVNKIKSRSDESTIQEEYFKTLTTQNETVNSSHSSLLYDEELIASTDLVKSNPLSYSTTMQQEIMMSEEDTNGYDYTSKSSIKPVLAFTHMKTANFSSSSIVDETKSTIDSTLQHIPSSYLYISDKTKMRKNSQNPLIHQSLPIHTQVNSDKNNYPYLKASNQNEHTNNLLKHTLSSKQKCRLKMPCKTDIHRHPMKF